MHPKPPLPAESNNEVVEVAESDDDDSGFSSDMLQLLDTDSDDGPRPDDKLCSLSGLISAHGRESWVGVIAASWLYKTRGYHYHADN